MATAKKAAATKRANAARRTAKGKTDNPHDANPSDPTDSSVKHADAVNASPDAGKGGYPSGEYDVTKPAPVGVQTKDAVASALAQHLDAAPHAEPAVKRAQANAQLSGSDFAKGVEAFAVGTMIEHEGPNRWRVHVVGKNKWGHGATFREAVEHFITGIDQTTQEAEAAQRLAALPAKQQQEIKDRDAKAAQAVGGTSSDTFARVENAKTAKADKRAKAPAPNANTDGPEKASARDEAGRKNVAGTE